jgi:hypothetical protein
MCITSKYYKKTLTTVTRHHHKTRVQGCQSQCTLRTPPRVETRGPWPNTSENLDRCATSTLMVRRHTDEDTVHSRGPAGSKLVPTSGLLTRLTLHGMTLSWSCRISYPGDIIRHLLRLSMSDILAHWLMPTSLSSNVDTWGFDMWESMLIRNHPLCVWV